EETEVEVALGADLLEEFLPSSLTAHANRPRLIECVRIVHRNGDFQRLSRIDRVPALHDMQLFGVRRAINIDNGLAVQADRVDNQRVALVMADRFSGPG